MTKLQWMVVGSALLVFFVIYFGCDTRPRQQKLLEKSRALASESTDIQVLLQEAKAEMDENQLARIFVLEQEAAEGRADSARVEALKTLSGQWFGLGYPAIAGFYAQEVANLLGTEESWSIAGTTYTICIQRVAEEKVRTFCTGRAVQAFENAISLNPKNLINQVNLALCYAENPPQDNPMRGILMLRDLNEQNPDNVPVLNALGRLAIRTGQFDRALERLERALALEPDNINTVCLLAQAYDGAGRTEEARLFDERCNAAPR